MNLFDRATRIAEATGDAYALTIDGQMYVVCEDYSDVAHRLVRSQMENIDVIHSEDVSTCDECGRATLNNACGYPTDWYPVADSMDNLVGFVCDDCAPSIPIWGYEGPEWKGPQPFTACGRTHWYR